MFSRFSSVPPGGGIVRESDYDCCNANPSSVHQLSSHSTLYSLETDNVVKYQAKEKWTWYEELVLKLSIRQASMEPIFIFFLLFPLGILLPLWSIGLISQFLDHSQTVGLLRRLISSSQGLYLNTGRHKHRINAYTHLTSMPWVGANEDSTCLSPLGYCDRPLSRMWISSTPRSCVCDVC
jgi:hypothetical protein